MSRMDFTNTLLQSGFVVCGDSPVPLSLLVSSTGGFVWFVRFDLTLTTSTHSHIVHWPAPRAWHGEVSFTPRLRSFSSWRVEVSHEGIWVRVLLNASGLVVKSSIDKTTRLINDISGTRNFEQPLLVFTILVEFYVVAGGGSPALLGDHLEDWRAALNPIFLVAFVPQYVLHVAPMGALPRRSWWHV